MSEAIVEDKKDAAKPRTDQHAPSPAAASKSADAAKPRNAGGATEAKPGGAPEAQPAGAWFDASVIQGHARSPETGSGQADASKRAGAANSVSQMQGNPTPFKLKDTLTFAGVVGHSTTPTSLDVVNQELTQAKVSFHIAGPDFTAFKLDAANPMSVPAKPEPQPAVDVRFVPNRPGRLEAVLLLNHEFGQQHVKLTGTAEKGDGQTTERDGKLPGVSTLPALNASTSRHLPDRLREAGRHVAEIGDRYNAVRPRAESALRMLNENSITAATSLHSRTNKWLSEEGIAEATSVEDADHVPTGVNVGMMALNFILGRYKSGNPGPQLPVAVVPIGISVGQFVVGKAIGFLLGHRADQRAATRATDGANRHRLAGAKASATDPMLSGIIAQLEGLSEELSLRMGSVGQVADKDAATFLAQLPEELENAEHGGTSSTSYKNAQKIVESYRESEGLLWQALANVELIAGIIVPKVDAAFNSLLDEYAIERHKQIAASGRDTRKLQVKIAGGFDLNQEPPVQLHHLHVEGIGNVSTTIREHLARKTLAELPEGCDATFTLNAIPYGTLTYEWDSHSKELYHHLLPYNEYNDDYYGKDLRKKNGYARIKSALLDMRIGDGVSL